MRFDTTPSSPSGSPLTRSPIRAAVLLCAWTAFGSALAAPDADEPWQSLTTADGSSVGKRHETSAVELNGRVYVLGGRSRKSASVFDSAQRTWRALPDLPEELHHFQPVAVGTKIYAIGAMTCCYPEEPGVATIHVFDTVEERWSTAGNVPAARIRGGAGAVLHEGWIYIVGGNTRGHSGGAVPWLDRFEPASERWEKLADAPNARDHFQLGLIDGRIVAAGGRQSTTPDVQRFTVAATDVYDIAAARWIDGAPIPTERGGSVTVSYDGEAIVLGGELSGRRDALDSVEAYDVDADRWRALSPLLQARHGAAAVVIGETLHIVAGSLQRGGGPETDSHETLDLESDASPDPDSDGDGLADADETALHGTDPNDADSDDDGLTDGREIEIGTDPLVRDGDADGLADGAEVDTHGTDPSRADSDDDGLDDGIEVDTHGTDPLDSDSDDDGLPDGAEIDTHGTDPLALDSDDDDLTDGAEVDIHGTDPSRSDTDGDGMHDGAEVAQGRDPTRADTTAEPVVPPVADPDEDDEPDPEPTPVEVPTPMPTVDPEPDATTDESGDVIDPRAGSGNSREGGGGLSWSLLLLGGAGIARRVRDRLAGRRLGDDRTDQEPGGDTSATRGAASASGRSSRGRP